MKLFIRKLSILLSLIFLFTFTSQSATFTVTNANDSGPGSLRQAIINANATVGQDIIDFNIAPPGVVHTIFLLSTLPVITDQMGVTIDGYTQPGASPNSNPPGTPSNAILLIQLSGTPGIDGIYSQTWRTVVKGLIISNLNRGIVIDGSADGANYNSILGCYIGTDPSGSMLQGNVTGIEINNGATGSMFTISIGDGTNAGRNLISGNGIGVRITGSGTMSVGVFGNFIGTDVNGQFSLGGFTTHGILIDDSASYNSIGGTSTLSRNIISGNSYPGFYAHGVEIRDPGTTNNTVINNYIGTDVTGSAALGNTGSGVRISNGTTSNTIGSYMNTAYGNVISGNGGTFGFSGIDILGTGTSSNQVEANFIGLDATGTSAVPNTGSGVSIFQEALANTIGGLSQNVISGNNANGVYIGDSATTNNVVYNNLIGLDATGIIVVANQLDGVLIEMDATSNQIGSSGSNPNYIAGNLGDGIKVKDSQTSMNVIQRNNIGWNTSMTPAGNGGDGIEVSGGASITQIGGVTSFFENNNVSNNGGHGILIDNSFGNQIISAPSMVSGPNIINNNTLDGIAVTGISSFGNTISQNSTSGNGGLGIDLSNDGVTANDLTDPDFGPNNLLNFPVITGANWYFISPPSGDAFIAGTIDIDTPPNLATVEVFSVSSPDATGHGQGDGFLGSCTPDALGNWGITISGMSTGTIITATTTDGNGNTSEFSLNDTLRSYDFGDAPSPWPTDMMNNGPQHLIVTGAPWLGNASDNPDADPDGLWLPPYAWMDDMQFMDDEGGVIFPGFIFAGSMGSVTFEVYNGPAYVDGWVDFDIDGSWTNMAGNVEKIVSGNYTTGIHNVNFTLPAGTKYQPTVSRFRINSTGSLTPLGMALDGEVEDHDVRLAIQWLGGTTGSENAWNVASNWSGGAVPTSLEDVVITSGMTYYPIINITSGCRDLIIYDGAQVTVSSSSANFTINNDLVVGQGTSGNYTQTGGTCNVVGLTWVKSGGTLIVSGGTFIP